MLKKITIDKTKLPVYGDFDFHTFQQHYVSVKKTHNQKSWNYILNYMMPTFLKWHELYSSKEYYSDITIYTLFRLLEADDKTPGTLENKLYLLNSYLSSNDLTFFDICLEAFILHLNKKSHIPAKDYWKDKYFFYYLTKETKMFIFSNIRKYILEYKRNALFYKDELASIPEFHYNETYLDYTFIDSLEADDLKIYLNFCIFGIQSSLNNKHFKTTNNLNEKKDNICQLIRQMPLNN